MSTQIAQQLDRIENATDIIKQKAADMGLVFEDEEGGTKAVSASDPIEITAGAIEDITVYTGETTETTGTYTDGPTVYVREGYYKGLNTQRVQEAQRGAPEISIDASTGTITATVEQQAGYVLEGTESATKQITHTNLNAENIKDGITIFGIEGTFTDDANVTSSYLTEGYTGYAKGVKVTGTMTNMSGETTVYFDPLTEETHVAIANPARVNYLKVELATNPSTQVSTLLERLSAI